MKKLKYANDTKKGRERKKMREGDRKVHKSYLN